MKRCFIIALLVMASAAFAQQPPAAALADATDTVAAKPPHDGKPIATVLAAWAKQHVKTLVVEPRLTALVKIYPGVTEFEQGLNLALKPYKNLIWRKVYLREKMELPKPERLTAMVRTMVSAESTDIIVQDPKASKISSFVKFVDVPMGFEAGLSKMTPPFGTKCIYVVIDKRPAWSQTDGLNLLDLIADPSLINENTLNEQNMAAIQKMTCESIMKMPPASRPEAIRGMGGMVDTLDVRTVVSWKMDAEKLMDSTSDKAEALLRRQIMENLAVQKELSPEDLALLIATGTYAQQPQPQSGVPVAVAGFPVSDGEPIAAVLAGWAEKYNKTLVVEPSLITQVKLDLSARTFEQGLDLALKPYQNISWRKVYLRAKAAQPKPDRLAAMVRTMVTLEASGLIVQEPTTSKIGSYVKSADVPTDYEAGLSKMNPAFAAKPVYVVFDAKPSWVSADGLNLQDLTADPSCLTTDTLNAQNIKAINQKLIEAMKKMDPESRAKAMKSYLESAEGCDARTRVGMLVASQKRRAKMTPEEIENEKRRGNEYTDVMREMGAFGMPPPEAK